MKVIKTFINHGGYYDNEKTFIVPAFSKILNIFIEYSDIYLLAEYDDLEEQTKTILVKTIEGLYITEDSTYQYWGTITQSNTLINNSNTVTGGLEINMIVHNINKYIHIFYQEIKPLCEMRDDKLNNLI